MANEHQLRLLESGLHSSDPEDSACLNGYCCGTYTPGNGCSYRWNAHEIAKDADTGVFDTPSDALVGRYTHAIPTTPFPSGYIYWWYAASIPPPQELGDWCLDGPTRGAYGKTPRLDFRNRPVPDGANFTRAYWPYWFNAHHIIPKGTFMRLIRGSTEAHLLLRTSLLLAKYNINGQRNMLILPMDTAVAGLLDLPRHLRLSSWRDSRNHPDYNDYVEGELQPIIDEYKRICDQATQEDHEMPDAELTKDRLLALSDDLYEQILSFGRGGGGAAIDDMVTD